MRKLFKIFIFLFVLSAPLAFALSALVPCGGEGQDPCTLCHLYALLQGIANFLMWSIAPALALLVVAWGGFNILIAGSDPGKKQAGFKAMKAALIGILIVFGAWIIINEFLLFLTNKSSFVEGVKTAEIFQNPWTKIECSTNTKK